MTEVITDVAQVTPAWLTNVLHASGALDRGHVTTVHARPLNIPGSSTKLHLDVQYSADTPPSLPQHLFLKLSRPDIVDILPLAGKKEVLFYTCTTTLADRERLPIVRCYNAVYASQTQQYHILLDDLTTSHVTVPGTIMPPLRVHCEQMVDALAQLHAYWWDHSRLGNDLGTLPTHDSEWAYLDWATTTFTRVADLLGERLSHERRLRVEQIFAAWPKLAERLTKQRHLTLVLGDVHSGQFLFPRNAATHAMRIIDWDWWDITVGPMDLAYTMCLFWFPERRARLEQELLRRYHDRLLEYGVVGYDGQACWEDYRWAAIRSLFVPLHLWETRPWPDFWHLHWERALLAFEDLGCAELLE